MNISSSTSSSCPSKPSTRNRKCSWPESSSINQNFSLPIPIIRYIAENPSTPKCYLKLVQSCKYFFEKKPLLIVKCICGEYFYSVDISYEKNQKSCVKINLKKLKTKIWLTNEFDFLETYNPNIASLILPKIYQCENAQLSIRYAEMSLEDFMLLATRFQKFYFIDANIIDSDGNKLMLESILKVIPIVKTFNYHFDDYSPAATTSTMKNILKLKNLDNLQELSLQKICEVIAVEDISNFINAHQNTNIFLHFQSDISAQYKHQLSKLIHTVVESGASNIFISYVGKNMKNNKIMYNRYSSLA